MFSSLSSSTFKELNRERAICLSAYMETLLKWPNVDGFHRTAFKSLLHVFEHDMDMDNYVNDIEIDRTIELAVEHKNEWALEAMFLHDTEAAIEYAFQYAQHTEWFLKFLQKRPELLREEDSYERSIFFNLCVSKTSVGPIEILDYILEKRPECLNESCGDNGRPLYNALIYKHEKGVVYLLQRGADYTYDDGSVFFDVSQVESIFTLFDYGAGYLLTTIRKDKNVLECAYDSMHHKYNKRLVPVFYALGLRSDRVTIKPKYLPSEEECASTRYRAYFRLSLSRRLLTYLDRSENIKNVQPQTRFLE